jgi:outer membrane receptor protein involved in Fe transport
MTIRITKSLRHALAAGCAVLALAPSMANAQVAGRKTFEIPSEDLGRALTQAARQAGTEIVFSADLTRGRRSPGVRGTMTVEQALTALLSGTGLTFQKRDQSGALIVRRADTPRPRLAPALLDEPNAAPMNGTALDEIIVTGVNREQRRFSTSFSVTSLSSADIDRLAPVNTQSLLNSVPGIYGEATGGEVNNVIRIRGIPNETSFNSMQEDGMPVLADTAAFLRQDGVNRIDLMTESVDVVVGGPSPIFASNAAAIINQITRVGGDTPEAAARITLGDTGLRRIDGYWSGPVGPGTYLAAGGFLRTHETGYKDSGFPSDEGGQFRVNLRHKMDRGEVRLSAKYLDDNNVFFLAIPLADPRAPSESLNSLINFFEGTTNTPALKSAILKYPTATGETITEKRDLSNGRGIKALTLGFDVERDISQTWNISNKIRFSDIRMDFDALYPNASPVASDAFAAAFLPAARTAFGANVAGFRYAIAGTNGLEAFDPTSTRGLVFQGQYRAIANDLSQLQNDTRLSGQLNIFGRHDLAIGLNYARYTTRYSQHYQDYLFEMRGRPRTLDLIAINSSGGTLGYVTDSGVLRYNTADVTGELTTNKYALYMNDQWQPNELLRIDFGLRYEYYDGSGKYVPSNSGFNLGDASTLADNAVQRPRLQPIATGYNDDFVSWTVGGSYDLSKNFGLYGRASQSYRAPEEGELVRGVLTPTTGAEQYEIGMKFLHPNLSAYVTAFYTRFEPFSASFQSFNPTNGRLQQLTFIGKATSPGVEVDVSVSPLAWLKLSSAFTYSKPKLGKLVNEFGAQATSVEGNLPVRQPELYGNLRADTVFKFGEQELLLGLRYDYVGRRFVDLQNTTQLPAYGTLAAQGTLNFGDWQLQLVGENLTEEKGLTEGNTRLDGLSGQGVPTAIFARTLYGRNFRMIATYRW